MQCASYNIYQDNSQIFIFNSLFETIYVIATILDYIRKILPLKKKDFSDPKHAGSFKGEEKYKFCLVELEDCRDVI